MVRAWEEGERKGYRNKALHSMNFYIICIATSKHYLYIKYKDYQ
jgi:hypothetical protein